MREGLGYAYGSQFPRSPSRMRQFAWLARSLQAIEEMEAFQRCADAPTTGP
jgi:hypothetical protein